MTSSPVRSGIFEKLPSGQLKLDVVQNAVVSDGWFLSFFVVHSEVDDMTLGRLLSFAHRRCHPLPMLVSCCFFPYVPYRSKSWGSQSVT